MVACTVSLPVRLIDYGLRDYGTAKWEGGDPNCEHTVGSGDNDNLKTYVTRPERDGIKRQYCQKCGAVRIDQQIGLEQTPAEYVNDIVQVFREVWRVLRDDGTVWLNLGDSYNGSGGAGGDYTEGGLKEGQPKYPGRHINNLKPKDLIGIPWMVAFALRDDGWYLRQDIIWHKPNPMPESVKDRCTKAHEYVFLLSKSPRYYYDYEAVLEPATGYDGRKDTKFKGSIKSYDGVMPGGKPQTFAQNGHERWQYKNLQDDGQQPNTMHLKRLEGEEYMSPVRNRRSVWTVPTSPYKGAHYATFPPKLIEPMILAGCPQVVCAKCGAPYVKVVTKSDWKRHQSQKAKDQDIVGNPMYRGGHHNDGLPSYKGTNKDYDLQPTCDCNAGTTSGIVLDPFVGSGTTVMVANQLGRRGIGLDLSFKYLQENAKERLATVQPIIPF